MAAPCSLTQETYPLLRMPSSKVRGSTRALCPTLHLLNAHLAPDVALEHVPVAEG